MDQLRTLRWTIVFFVFAFGTVAPAPAQPSFHGLGDLPGGLSSSAALAVSSDGSVVVGSSVSAVGAVAVRWTLGAGLAALPTLPGSCSWGSHAARGASEGGAVVVGSAQNAFPKPPDIGSQGFLWTSDEGTRPLGEPCVDVSGALGISDDGSIIVGHEDFRPALWTAGSGWVRLGALPGAVESGYSAGISPDGVAIVGVADSSRVGVVGEAFRWSKDTGMVGLGVLKGRTNSIALDAASGGDLVVGQSGSPSERTSEAFFWTQDNGMVPLGDLPGGVVDGVANAVSSDGGCIVGRSSTSLSGGGAFIWDPKNGLQQLHAVLTQEYDLDLEGWTLSSAEGLSADGRTIVGTGRNPAGQSEGWIVYLGLLCRVDWNNDGVVSSDDFFAFLDDFFAGKGDFNGDRVVNSDDYFAFLGSFFEGCP